MTDRELASSILTELQQAKLCPLSFVVRGNALETGRGSLILPTNGAKASWRRTVNTSFTPRSVSSENRRQLLYAVLQDLVQQKLLLHADGTEANPLQELADDLSVFQRIYWVPVKQSRTKPPRKVVFPVHVSIPLNFDTYPRGRTKLDGPDAGDRDLKPQTDKGFRGAFIHFFSSDPNGTKRRELFDALIGVFSSVSGMSVLDRLLVAAATRRLKVDPKWANVPSEFKNLQPDCSAAAAGREISAAGWEKVFDDPLSSDEKFRPMPELAQQGRRLTADIVNICRATGLDRLSQVAAIESLLGYHFSLYLLRLVNLLYRELASISDELFPGFPNLPWRGQSARILYRDRRQRPQREWKEDYDGTVRRLNEAYLLLPVLNAVEGAIRASTGDREVKMQNLEWVAARERRIEDTASVAGAVRFWTAMVCRYNEIKVPMDMLRRQPIVALANAVRFYYTPKEQARFPNDHHGLVFEQTALDGAGSFRQVKPFKHFGLGQELLRLLAFVSFDSDRGLRMPLDEFEERLRGDLLDPADDRARDSLVDLLRAIGLIDRLSDVGKAHFLRRPQSV